MGYQLGRPTGRPEFVMSWKTRCIYGYSAGKYTVQQHLNGTGWCKSSYSPPSSSCLAAQRRCPETPSSSHWQINPDGGDNNTRPLHVSAFLHGICGTSGFQVFASGVQLSHTERMPWWAIPTLFFPGGCGKQRPRRADVVNSQQSSAGRCGKREVPTLDGASRVLVVACPNLRPWAAAHLTSITSLYLTYKKLCLTNPHYTHSQTDEAIVATRRRAELKPTLSKRDNLTDWQCFREPVTEQEAQSDS